MVSARLPTQPSSHVPPGLPPPACCSTLHTTHIASSHSLPVAEHPWPRSPPRAAGPSPPVFASSVLAAPPITPETADITSPHSDYSPAPHARSVRFGSPPFAYAHAHAASQYMPAHPARTC